MYIPRISIDYKGWKCWDLITGDVFISRDVHFVETEMPGAELGLPGPCYEPMSGSVGEPAGTMLAPTIPSDLLPSPSVPSVDPGMSHSDSDSEPDLDDDFHDPDFIPEPSPDVSDSDVPCPAFALSSSASPPTSPTPQPDPCALLLPKLESDASPEPEKSPAPDSDSNPRDSRTPPPSQHYVTHFGCSIAPCMNGGELIIPISMPENSTSTGMVGGILRLLLRQTSLL